jgi:hypothetical protein
MPKPVTAAVVRERMSADSKRTAGLSEAALHTLAPGARGRLHPEVISAYNKGRKPAQRYVLGATRAAVTAQKAQNVALREQAAKAGITVGKRGPLPKAFLASLKG